MREWDDRPVAGPDVAAARDVISPLGPTVYESEALAEVARHLSAQADTVVMMNAAGRAVRTITAADVEIVARQDPEGWTTRRCTHLVEVEQGRVRPEHPMEGVVWHYQHGAIRPLLVFNGEGAVGLVHPSAVFQWCAEHLPAVLPALSQRAADQAAATQPS